METIVDLLEDAAARFADRNALGLRMDDGSTWHWTYAEVLRRSRIAAWRLRALGLNPGDRVLTWSPSTPALPAAYFGAMYAGLVFVPLDARMAPDTVGRIVDRSGAVRLLLGSGRDAPDPREVELERFPTSIVEDAVRRARRHVPARLGGAARGLAAPEARRHLRARVHLGHDRQPQGRDPHPRERARRARCRSTGSSTRWSTGSCRCSRCPMRSSRRCRCTTRSTSAPTCCTCGAGTRG